MSYRTLDPHLITETAARLESRVADRFPDTGLRRVAAELVTLSRDVAASSADLARPILWARAVIAFCVVAGAGAVILVGALLRVERFEGSDILQAFQGIEASINTAILATLGFLALIRLEERIKRARVFRELHGLRSLIHVIDMHQLTKDPSALNAAFTPTPHSPRRITNRADLIRYLDYCSEMLSITGKLAALYAQSVNDDVVVEAVNDVETLGSNLSRKIWQKITILDSEVRSPSQ